MIPTANEQQRGRLFRRPRLIASAVLLVGLAVGGGVWWSARREPMPEPPIVPLAELEPRVARSIEQAQQRVRESPRSGPAWGRLGTILGGHGLRPQAIDCFAVAERFDRAEPRWPYFRGTLLQLGGAEAEALPPLRRAVELCPLDPDAPRARLAALLLKQAHLEEAEEHFRALLSQTANHPVARLGLARVAVARGNLTDGRNQLGNCLDSPFVRKAAHLLLAEIEQRQGAKKEARGSLRRASSFPPDRGWPDPFLDEVDQLRVDSQMRVQRAMRLRGQGRTQEAEQLLEEVEEDHPGTYPLMQARRYLKAKDLKAAEQACREAVRMAPDFPQTHFWLGVVLLERNDAKNAATHFRAALRLQPRHARAAEQLGRCLEALGDRAGAIAAYRTTVRYLPQQAAAHARLGQLLADEGQDAEALKHLLRVLSLSPDDAKSRALVERIQKRQAEKRP